MVEKHILIVYYSLSQQTGRLVHRFCEGLNSSGVKVEICCLRPKIPLTLPIKSNISLFRIMWWTFWRTRIPIEDVEFQRMHYDHIVIAGPTWSYQPSGPILDFLDRYGRQVVAGHSVSFLITCRSYWRTHYWGMKRICSKLKGIPKKPIIFKHPTHEPWCTIGLLLWLRGIYSDRQPNWFRKRYPSYGHSEEQLLLAEQEGEELGQRILANLI